MDPDRREKSHPARVRGLKHRTHLLLLNVYMSHPARVRGLKQPIQRQACSLPMSHPARVRGLKRGHAMGDMGKLPVAPRAGAWIETSPRKPSPLWVPVAPRAGAWIETLSLPKTFGQG